ncbi:MAG TPA: hypothetical protein VIW45_00345 [Vicinamibacterales bacterium]
MLPEYVPTVVGQAILPVLKGPTTLLSLPIAQLGEVPLAEVWPADTGMLMAAMSCDAADAQQAAACVNDRLIEFVRNEGFPHLVRVWNHIEDINREVDGLERYRAFCAGRAEAFERHGYAMRGDLPASSGVGMDGPGVAAYCIASRVPAMSVENPRQVSAYDYPRRYGPRSPSFSRAAVINGVVFVSGTASIVGHETRHAGDVVLQLSETMLNLEVVLAAARARELAAAKVYLRRAEDYGFVAARLRTAWPRTQMLFLRADLCRADLLVEIEGVAVT